MEFNIAVLGGDGIGPEVTEQSVKVLKSLEALFEHRFNIEEGDVGGASIDKHGTPVKPEVLDMAASADAVLFGAVGGPKWDDPSATMRPEDAILQLRAHLGVFANIRPVKVYPWLADSSVLKPEVIKDVDLVMVRELTGGLYYGLPKERVQTPQGWSAVDTMRYSESEINRILRVGFELARSRQKKLASVDKANVLECSRLWRQLATEMSEDYPDWVSGLIAKLQEKHVRCVDTPENRKDFFEEINHIAHDMKGQGGTFGYPLITAFADSLYNFTTVRVGITDNMVEIIKAHVDAMKAVIRGRVSGDGGEVGAVLTKSLNQAIEKYEE